MKQKEETKLFLNSQWQPNWNLNSRKKWKKQQINWNFMITACVLMEGMKVDYANQLAEPTLHLTKVMPWGFAGDLCP